MFYGDDSFSPPQEKLLAVNRVKHTPYNPASRVLPGKLKSLASSMSQVGQLYPILVGERDSTVIEGNRRLAAARMLGWKCIRAIVAKGDIDAHTLYATINTSSAKMTGNESLVVWLSQPAAVSPVRAKQYAVMSEALGRAMVREIAAAGLTHTLFKTAVLVGRYVGTSTPTYVKQVTRWLMDTAVQSHVRVAMQSGAPAGEIAAAVKNNRPLLFVVGSGGEKPTPQVQPAASRG